MCVNALCGCVCVCMHMCVWGWGYSCMCVCVCADSKQSSSWQKTLFKSCLSPSDSSNLTFICNMSHCWNTHTHTGMHTHAHTHAVVQRWGKSQSKPLGGCLQGAVIVSLLWIKYFIWVRARLLTETIQGDYSGSSSHSSLSSLLWDSTISSEAAYKDFECCMERSHKDDLNRTESWIGGVVQMSDVCGRGGDRRWTRDLQSPLKFVKANQMLTNGQTNCCRVQREFFSNAPCWWMANVDTKKGSKNSVNQMN